MKQALEKANQFSALVVDDSKTQAIRLKRLLEANGIAVEIAFDGIEAGQLLEDKHFDIVLSDVVMPGKNGFELCRQIKTGSFPMQDHPPVILLTSLNQLGDKIKSLEAGADTFLLKPYPSQKLLDTVLRFLKIKVAT